MENSSSTAGERCIEIKLNIQSHNQNVPAAPFVKDVDQAVQEFSKSRPREEQVRFSVDRQKTYPIGIETVVVTVVIYVGIKVADAVISKVTEDVYRWVKDKLKPKATVTRKNGD